MRKTFARGRILPQSLSTDPRYGRLSWKARVLYPLVWTSCDDQGRISGDSDEIKYAICPNMDDILKEDIPELLSELETRGFIKVYSTSKRQAIQMLDWWEVQKLQWAWPSDYPAPPGWADRLRYKKGKKQVVTENWDSPESSPEHSPERDDKKVSPESSAEHSPERDNKEVSPESSAESSPETPQAPERGKVKNQESKLKNQNSNIKNQVLISPEHSGEDSGERSPPKGGLPGRGLFENLLEQIKSAPDRQKAIAGVGELYQVCAGRDPPYERIGVIAKKVSYDYGYLAKLIWETAGKRPAGDLLDYVDGILRSKKGEEAKDKRGKVHGPKDFSGRDW